jgi:DNA-binding response OmpR family regulator
MTVSRILVVDDDTSLRELIQITLSFETYEVSQASSSAEAIGLLEGQPIDLVILDLNLMEVDGGFKVCARSQELRPPPKVIMLTGSVSAEDEARCRELGAFAYVTKPFRPLELLEIVKRSLSD